MKMHENEIEIDISVVQELISNQFSQWAGLPIEPVASMGTDNALFRVGDALQARLPRIHWALDNIDKEFTWLPRIKPFVSVPITTPLHIGKPIKQYPFNWAIYDWLEGENPEPGCPNCCSQFVQDIVDFIKQMRKINLPDSPRAARGMPLIVRDEPTRKAIKELDGVIDTSLATNIWEEALAVPYWDRRPVWVHGDLLPGNILIRDGRLSGVIDFSCMGLGDPACDLIVAWNLLDASARTIFRSLLEVDDNTWIRGQAWALSQSLLILPYYKDSNPALVDVANYTLSGIFSDYNGL
jgi:aminoglycoside phosphotransferase (APT) family kinase protein